MHKYPASPALIPVLALIAAMISIQTGASLAKQLFPVLGAQGMATLRLCFAAALLAVICRPWRLYSLKQPFRPLLFYGLSMGCMNLLIYLALMHIPLGIAVALEFTGPLGVAVCTSRRFVDFIWVAGAAAGMALLLPDSGTHLLQWQGFAYALAAGFCWAMYIVFGQKAGRFAPGGQITSAGMVIAALAIAPVGIWHSGSLLLHVSLWPAALSVALLSSALPYYLEMHALKALPAKTFGVLMSMEPAIAALSGLLILREQLSLLQWSGIGCIIIASAGAMLSVRKVQLA